MEFLELTDEYKTQIESIDLEHGKLVDYINKIIEAADLGPAAQLTIEITLDEIIKYTVYHFKHEEDIMVELEYPNYEAHKKAHDNLKEQLMELKKRFDANEDVSEELVTFLKDWLLKHIKGVDTLYIDTFKNNGIK